MNDSVQGKGPPGETIRRLNIYVDQAGRKVIEGVPIEWPGKANGDPPPATSFKAEFVLVMTLPNGQVHQEPSTCELQATTLNDAFGTFDNAARTAMEERARATRKILQVPVITPNMGRGNGPFRAPGRGGLR